MAIISSRISYHAFIKCLQSSAIFMETKYVGQINAQRKGCKKRNLQKKKRKTMRTSVERTHTHTHIPYTYIKNIHLSHILQRRKQESSINISVNIKEQWILAEQIESCALPKQIKWKRVPSKRNLQKGYCKSVAIAKALQVLVLK